MGQFRELRFLLALTIIGLFTVSVFNAFALADVASAASAYRSAVICALAFVWGMMNWLPYEDPVRFREVVLVTVVGLALLSVLEISLVVAGIASGAAVSPSGLAVPLEDALWGESAVFSGLALLLFYFRPPRPSMPLEVIE